jgi:hypothetical protein
MPLLKKSMKVAFACFFFCTLSVSAQAAGAFCGSIQENSKTGEKLAFGVSWPPLIYPNPELCESGIKYAQKALQDTATMTYLKDWQKTCPNQGCTLKNVKDPDLTKKSFGIDAGTGINAMIEEGSCDFYKIYKESSSISNTSQLKLFVYAPVLCFNPNDPPHFHPHPPPYKHP